MPNNPRHKQIQGPLRKTERAVRIHQHQGHTVHHPHGPMHQYPPGVIPHISGEVDPHSNFTISVGENMVMITWPDGRLSGAAEMPPDIYEAVFRAGLSKHGT